jgi:hypothetical protein
MFARSVIKTLHCRSISYLNEFHRKYVQKEFMKKCCLTTIKREQSSNISITKFRKDPRSLREQFGDISGNLKMNNTQFVQVMHYMCSPEEYIQVLSGKPVKKILDLAYDDVKKLPTGEWSIQNPDDSETYLYLTEEGVKSFPKHLI